MATISVDTYLDDGTARSAGETWTLNSGAKLTVRTDTRWHAGSPAAMAGTFGSMTINEGEIFFTGETVRWLAYDTGSGNVPAISANVTQAGVSASYLLGVYASITSAPTAVGAAMPVTGFLKFREVTGAFAAGALTGIGANATAADVAGWIEVIGDSGMNVTVPRLGKLKSRGAWFYLDNTNGSIGQVLQVPTNGGGAGTRCPGVWIETAPGANTYEFWPALNGATNGWNYTHIGAAAGETDRRQSFVKDIGSGQMQIGESTTLAATYANIAAQASTYASIAHSATYTWAGDIVTVAYASGHLFSDGQQVHLDFTSGGATAFDGIYTVTVIDAYTYTVPLAGSGASGNVTARPGHTITFTAHGLGVGDVVYCDFTSGAGVDGDYTIYAVTGANAYLISAPHAATTSGNVSVHSQYRVSFTSHGLAIGNRVYLDFTSGAGVDGVYTIVAVAANTFDVIANNNGAADSGNVTVRMTIGHIPASGCKTRIPNVIMREAATASRAANLAPNATIATRPEMTTTSAGAIDLEYAYSNWYHNLNQAYSVRHVHFSTFDTLVITECATALDISDGGMGMYGALDVRAMQLTSNFAGGTLTDIKAHRGNTPGTTDHAVEVLYCSGQTFTRVDAGIIQYARSTGKAFQINYSQNLTFTSCRQFNSDFPITGSSSISITSLDHCDRYMGYTNGTTGYYAVVVGSGCTDITVDGLTFGYAGTVPNVHPYNGLFNATAAQRLVFKNGGTRSSMLSGGTWRPNLYGCTIVYVSGGNNNTVRLQRIYLTTARTSWMTTINSDKNVIYESIFTGRYVMSAMAVSAALDAGLNSIYKGCFAGVNSTTGQTSVYGTHFMDLFMGDTVGRFILAMNEPTAQTTAQFTMVSGTAKWNSSGGIFLGTIGYQAIWEDSVFRKGHTGFMNASPTMSGGTIGNFTVEYQIDTGSGYGGVWKTADGANLSGETISATVGFKMKVRLTCTGTDANAITYLRFNTTSSVSGQTNGLYTLAVPTTVTVTVKDASTSAVVSGAMVYLLTDAGGPDPAGTQIFKTTTDVLGKVTTTYYYSGTQPVIGRVRKAGTPPLYKTSPIGATITAAGLDLVVFMVPDA